MRFFKKSSPSISPSIFRLKFPALIQTNIIINVSVPNAIFHVALVASPRMFREYSANVTYNHTHVFLKKSYKNQQTLHITLQRLDYQPVYPRERFLNPSHTFHTFFHNSFYSAWEIEKTSASIETLYWIILGNYIVFSLKLKRRRRTREGSGKYYIVSKK